MPVSRKDLGIDQMSPEDRYALAQEILDSLVAKAEQAPLTEAQKEDLKVRLAAYEANPKAGSSWEQVKARLRDRS